MITGEQIAEAARKYIGSPIVEGGRSQDGLDCVGLMLCTARDLGLSFPAEVTNYGMNIWLHPRTRDAREFLSHYMVQVDSPAVGDVILFSRTVIAITVGFITGVDKEARVQKVISGLHGPRTYFAEHDLQETGCTLAGYRFRELTESN